MAEPATRMQTDAREAQKFSRRYLVLELDFSAESVQELERQCDAVEYALRGGKSPENVELLTRLWGAYLGEVFRIQLGAQWSSDTDDPASVSTGVPLLQLQDEELRPHEQVRQRLLNGPAYDLAEYFAAARTRHWPE